MQNSPIFKRALLLGVLGWTLAANARAHAFIDHAEPAVGSTVQKPPAEVCLRFNEAVETGFCSLKVFDAAGTEVDAKDVHADAKNQRYLIVSLPKSLGPGTYKVRWRAVSVDTHVTQGDFTFLVKP